MGRRMTIVQNLTGLLSCRWTDDYGDGSSYTHELVLIGREVMFRTQRPADGVWVDTMVRNPERFGPLDATDSKALLRQWRAWVDNFIEGDE